MTRFLIAEPGHTGHVLVYVALLTDHAQGRGHEVHWLLTEAALASPEFEQHLAQVPVEQVHTVPGPVGLDAVARTGRHVEADVVVVPNGDLFVAELARRGWAGAGALRLLIMRDPRWEDPTELRRKARLVLKRLLIRVVAARGVDVVWLRQPGHSGTERHANDPVISSVPVPAVHAGVARFRAALGMDDDTYWFGMTGAISAHKNLPLVCDSLRLLHRRAPSRPFGFALIGPRNPALAMTETDIEAELRSLPIPTVRRDQVMSNDEMNLVVASLDCVVMAYSSSSPNSTLAKAAAFGTSVAAAGDRSIETFVADLGMGPTARLTSEALATLLEQRMSAPRPESRPDLLVDHFSPALMD